MIIGICLPMNLADIYEEEEENTEKGFDLSTLINIKGEKIHVSRTLGIVTIWNTFDSQYLWLKFRVNLKFQFFQPKFQR